MPDFLLKAISAKLFMKLHQAIKINGLGLVYLENVHVQCADY